MKTTLLILLLFLFASCNQNSKQETSTPESLANETKRKVFSNNLIVTDSSYILIVKDNEDTFKTVAQLGKTLESVRSQVGEDSMYIYLRNTISDRMVEVSLMLRKLNINYQYIITEDVFDLPYPEKNKKVEQQ